MTLDEIREKYLRWLTEQGRLNGAKRVASLSDEAFAKLVLHALKELFHA